jgi:uncharacterized protein YjbJ (UPF0337 family)
MAFLLVEASGLARSICLKNYSPASGCQRLAPPVEGRSAGEGVSNSAGTGIDLVGYTIRQSSFRGVTAMDKDRIAGSAKDFAGKVEGAVGDVAGDAKTQAAGRAREAAGTVQNLYGQAKDAARDAGDAAVSYAKDAYENSGDTFRDGSQAVAKGVKENPFGALLVAGGIGFALALLMTRPPRRPPQRWRYYS